MSIPGLFIEYLISGALALIWIYRFIPEDWVSKLQTAHIPLLALGLYIVGMAIDFFAWILTSHTKEGLRRWYDEGKGFRPQNLLTIFKGKNPKQQLRVSFREIKFAVYAPEVAKEAAMRSSRDRVARGAIINSILFTSIIPNHRLIGGGFILTSIAMWLTFEVASYSYEVKAEKIIDQKIEMDNRNAST
jgi:hypothetical protein